MNWVSGFERTMDCSADTLLSGKIRAMRDAHLFMVGILVNELRIDACTRQRNLFSIISLKKASWLAFGQYRLIKTLFTKITPYV